MISSKTCKTLILPVRICACEGAEDADLLLEEKETQITIQEKRVTVFRRGYVILDFGRELVGGIRILTGFAKDTYDGVRVRVRFGESYGEANTDVLPMGTATNCHSPRDFITYLPSFSDLTLGQTGFRFVRIDFLESDAVAIKNIYAVDERLDAEPIGSFACSDKLVNDIWNVSKDTAILCAQNGFIWDGIKRDRLVWAGDLFPEVKAFIALYGDLENVRNSLDLCRDASPAPEWMCNMPTYSLWWMILQREVYFATGDRAYLEKNSEYLRELVRRIDECVGEDGIVRFVPGKPAGTASFLDWSTADTPDAECGSVSLVRLALNAMNELDIGVNTKKILARMDRAKRLSACAKPAVAMQTVAGELAPHEALPKLLENGADGFSTFMSYPILKAIAMGGERGKALKLMRDYYGGMLSRGATSFWEDFDIKWLDGSGRIDCPKGVGEKDLHGDFGRHCYVGFRHSLCHGWASGPVAYIAEEVLGIKVLSPGCGKIALKPDLCGLEWAEGSFPTPFGPVRVRAEKHGASVNLKIDAPKEIEIVK